MRVRGRDGAWRRVVIRSEFGSMETFGRLARFSLHGGPLYRLGRRLGLVRGETNTFPLGLAIGLSAWSILLALAFIGGVGDRLFSLSTIGGNVRLLVVIPLLFSCKSSLDPHFRGFVSTIVRSGVVPSNALPALESEIARIDRWKEAWLPEAMCLLAAALLRYLRRSCTCREKRPRWIQHEP